LTKLVPVAVLPRWQMSSSLLFPATGANKLHTDGAYNRLTNYELTY